LHACPALSCSEWQVRKAAADTLAATAAALLEEPAASAGALAATAAAAGNGGGGGGGGERQGQAQGVAALEGVAPAMLAALERYVRYDRVPQVRTAAAAALQQLRRVPRLQQEQRPPPGQLQGGGNGKGAAAAAAGPAHVAAPQAGSPLRGLGRSGTSLHAAIAERRQQLKASGERRRPPDVEVYSPAGGGSAEWERSEPAAAAAAAGKPLLHGGGGSCVGSADGGEWEAARGRIRAWAGGGFGAPVPSPPQAASPLAAQQLRGRAAAEHAEVVLPRPPSPDVFRTADEALYCLKLEAEAREARRRRPWATRPSSPAQPPAAADDDNGLPLPRWSPAGAAPPQALAHTGPAERQVWRANPLAEAQTGGGGRPFGVAAAAHCVHHIERPQVCSRSFSCRWCCCSM
jgi:hypothetical protein